MKTILIDFNWSRDKDPRIPLGHASILSFLAQFDRIQVTSLIFSVNKNLSVKDVVEKILGKVDSNTVLAFGVYIWGESIVRKAIRLLREKGFRGQIILGGPQISYSGPGLEEIYPEADVFIRGFGEEALAELLLSSKKTIQGVHWKGEFDNNLQANLELSNLSSPWLNGICPVKNQAFVRWETQRGCPFRCAFCQHHEPGSRLKRSNLDYNRIKAEIELFCRSGVKEIAVLDPIFNMGPYAIEILEYFHRLGFKGRLALQCRAETTTDEFLEAASKLDVKLEFGLQTVIEEESQAIKRKNQIPIVDKVLGKVRDLGIFHEVSLIFGLPLQTTESFLKSVDWCLERQVPVIRAFPLLLLRGTALELEKAKWGLISMNSTNLAFESNSYSFEDWSFMAKISEALKLTENAHPKNVIELANKLQPDLDRWNPDNVYVSGLQVKKTNFMSNHP